MFQDLDPQWSAPTEREKELNKKRIEVHKLTCKCGKCGWMLKKEGSKTYKYRGVKS